MGKGKVGMGTHRWMSVLDGSKFHPFRIFQNYYIHYSTWFGAAWPLGIVALLVIYCGSDIISWGKHPNTQDTSVGPVGVPPAPFSYSIPPIGLQFFSPSTGLVLDESYVRFEFSVCTKTVTNSGSALNSSLYSNLGPNVTIGSLFSSTIYTTTVSCTPLPLSYACGLGSCPNALPELVGSSTSTSQKYVTAKMIVCDQTTASFLVDESLAAMPGVYQCSSGACTRNVTCVNSTTLASAMTGGFIAVNAGNNVDPELLKVTDLNDIGFNSSTTFLYDARYLLKPEVLFQAMRYQVLPVFFGETTDYYFTQYLSSESTYGNSDGTSTRATFTFALHPLAMDTRILPISVFTMLSRFGQVIAACAIANIFVKRFNFISFYAIADENYFVPDISTRKFLLANRKTRVKEFENMLLYVFTFGGSERFGLQTRQLFQFFNDRTKRFDRKETEAVVEDIQKFLMSRRIGKFVNEEEKVGRSVEANYNITALGGRLSRVEAAMQGLSKVPVPGADDENISDKAAIIREVETTLKLCTLQDELSKMKVICASLFPQQAKRERLAEQLAGK